MALSLQCDLHRLRRFFRFAFISFLINILGCASPGPPQPPSLHLPALVTNLTASRIGGTVVLRFTPPAQSTDKLPLRGGSITGQFCRQLPHGPCNAVSSSKTAISISGPDSSRGVITWIDTLPSDLAQGQPRPLAYRVEFFNASGRSAGPSAPAFTAAGSAPLPVEDLHIQGSRLGAVITWKATSGPGEVLIQREDLAPKAAKPPATRSGAQVLSPLHPPGKRQVSAAQSSTDSPSTVWLGTHELSQGAGQMLDTTALPGHPYRYSAVRRLTVVLNASSLNGRSIELRSQPTPPIEFTLRQIYPPPAPTGLTAAGYFSGETSAASVPSSFAVDLVWQPVDDAGLITPLAGYNVYRQRLQAAGTPSAAAGQAMEAAGQALEQRMRLNTTPVAVPAFHDTTANPATAYRYSVTAVDIKGNESPAATILLPSSAQP
jgi:hypothetical protein